MPTLTEQRERSALGRRPTANETVRDVLLRRAHDWFRWESGCLRGMAAAWRTLRGEITSVVRQSELYATTGGTPLGLARPEQLRAVQDLVGLIAGLTSTRLGQMQACLDTELPRFAALELQELPVALERALNRVLDRSLQEAVEVARPPVLSVSMTQAPVQQAAELLSSPLGGALHQQAFRELETATLGRLRTTLVSGLMSGGSVATVSRNVQAALNTTRDGAETIVRSEFVRVGNQAALLTYQQNKRLLKGVQWSATLDRRTCPICFGLDGRVWEDPDKSKIPVTSSHPLCRCSLLPVLKNAEQLGLPTTPSTRASFDGQVPDAMPYSEWFKRQGEGFQRQVLGPTRFGLYQSGTLELKQFSGAAGIRPVRELSEKARGATWSKGSETLARAAGIKVDELDAVADQMHAGTKFRVRDNPIDTWGSSPGAAAHRELARQLESAPMSVADAARFLRSRLPDLDAGDAEKAIREHLLLQRAAQTRRTDLGAMRRGLLTRDRPEAQPLLSMKAGDTVALGRAASFTEGGAYTDHEVQLILARPKVGTRLPVTFEREVVTSGRVRITKKLTGPEVKAQLQRAVETGAEPTFGLSTADSLRLGLNDLVNDSVVYFVEAL